MNSVIRLWQLQEAKNRFSQVVNLACQEGPQLITSHSKKKTVLLSWEEYEKISQPQETLLQFLQKSPLASVVKKLDLRRSKNIGRVVDLVI